MGSNQKARAKEAEVKIVGVDLTQSNKTSPVGPAKIRATEPRKQKHDRRDARLIFELLTANPTNQSFLKRRFFGKNRVTFLLHHV